LSYPIVPRFICVVCLGMTMEPRARARTCVCVCYLFAYCLICSMNGDLGISVDHNGFDNRCRLLFFLTMIMIIFCLLLLLLLLMCLYETIHSLFCLLFMILIDYERLDIGSFELIDQNESLSLEETILVSFFFRSNCLSLMFIFGSFIAFYKFFTWYFLILLFLLLFYSGSTK
jgi:hypothetical protein